MFHRDCQVCRIQRREVVGAVLSIGLILALMFGLG